MRQAQSDGYCLTVALVYGAERLNALGGRHWQRFAGQNYFDEGGIFVSAVLSAPLVFTMFVVLVRFIHRLLCYLDQHSSLGIVFVQLALLSTDL